MSKRIVIFCSDLINATGPLPPDELGQKVLAAGLTKSLNPVTAIRNALRQSPVMVQLPDGRFDSARRMLDGVALTHRVRFATKGNQILYAGPELSILDQILVHEGSLALTAGGAITSSLGEFDGWCGPPNWLPDVPADSLLAFRFRNGRLSVEPVLDEPSPKSDEVERLRVVLRRYLMNSDDLDRWRSHHTLGKVMLRALAEVPDILIDPLPPLDEILQLGNERWTRDWPVESVDGVHDGQRITLDDVPPKLVAALRRDADRLGVTTGELTVLLLSAATYRTAMPCRHDAQESWLNHPPYADAPDRHDRYSATSPIPHDKQDGLHHACDDDPDNNHRATPADDGEDARDTNHGDDPDPDNPDHAHQDDPEDDDGAAPSSSSPPPRPPSDHTPSEASNPPDQSDDCDPSDDFEEIWIDDLPEAVLALKPPPG